MIPIEFTFFIFGPANYITGEYVLYACTRQLFSAIEWFYNTERAYPAVWRYPDENIIVLSSWMFNTSKHSGHHPI